VSESDFLRGAGVTRILAEKISTRAGCGYAVLLLGLVCTTRWAKATAARLGRVSELAAENAGH
jgi:hypothetical protein